MNDLEQAEEELNEAVFSGEEGEVYEEKKKAYGVACHALTCGLCRGHHDDQCWERKLIMGEL